MGEAHPGTLIDRTRPPTWRFTPANWTAPFDGSHSRPSDRVRRASPPTVSSRSSIPDPTRTESLGIVTTRKRDAMGSSNEMGRQFRRVWSAASDADMLRSAKPKDHPGRRHQSKRGAIRRVRRGRGSIIPLGSQPPTRATARSSGKTPDLIVDKSRFTRRLVAEPGVPHNATELPKTQSPVRSPRLMGRFHRFCMSVSAAVVFLSASTARVAPAEEPAALKTFSSIGKESRA